MLFSIRSDTPKSRVFILLNRELGHFLKSCVDSTTFNRQLFSRWLGTEIWSNFATKNKFDVFWKKYSQLSRAERITFFKSFQHAQNLVRYFGDHHYELPNIPPSVIGEFKSLTNHLYSETKKLVGVERIATESVGDHYQKYISINGNLCFVCGTELLAQRRNYQPLNEQWKSDYDHLLCQKYYPYFAVHPQNFLPTCHTCNSKAKGFKNILEDSTGQRCLAFYPHESDSFKWMSVVLVMGPSSIIELAVNHIPVILDIEQKLNVWIQVYDVPKRVEAELANFNVWLSTDCRPRSYSEFCEQIRRRATPTQEIKTRPLFFWRLRLYQWLVQQDDKIKHAVWGIVQPNTSSDALLRQEFGI